METWELVASLSIALVPLYSRLVTRADALRSRTRARIVEHLRARGPRRLMTLARELALDKRTVREHVRVLRLHSHVRVARRGPFAIVALPGQDPGAAVVTASQRAQDAILRVVIDHGGEIARPELDRYLPPLPPRVRNRALTELVRAGRIRRDLDGAREVVRLRSIPPPRVSAAFASARATTFTHEVPECTRGPEDDRKGRP